MSEITKKKNVEKKINKGIIKNNNNEPKNNVNQSKKDNNSNNISIKNKKVAHSSLPNIHRKLQDKNKLKKRNEGDIPFNLVFKQGKFLNDTKILKNFLSFFNIRELFIIMELDTHIFQAVMDSEVFKKYLLIRKDFIPKNDIENNKKNKLKKVSTKTSEEISDVIISGDEKDLNNTDKNEVKKVYENKNFGFKLPVIDFQKLKIKYLINNNCHVMKKYIKTFSLNNFESSCIFNGIIEYLLIKENGIPMENHDPKNFSLLNNRVLNNLNFYMESLINLNYPEIIKLDLSNVGISSLGCMKKLYILFQKYSSTLKILSLANNGINDKFAKLLFSGLENNRVLEILNLSNNEIGEEGLENSEEFFSKNKSLHTLSFHHNLLGPNGVDFLFNYFVSNKNLSLKSIEIGYNGITKEVTEFISKYIKNNENLITFNIEGNYLCNEGIKKICEAISQKNSQNIISYIDLQNNNITNKGCFHISKMLSESQFINSISLRNNLLDNDGVSKIISSICSTNSNLVSIDLSDTKIDEKAMNTISEAINKDVALQKINLSYNNFRLAGKSINNLLIKETNLKYLDFSFCNISNHFNLIFQGLSKNQNLKLINLSGNSIPTKKDVLNELGKAISENTNLRKLLLNECNIDDNAMNIINNNLEKNHTLLNLSLNHNFISKKSIPGLENAINKSKVINHVYLYENDELNIKLINQIENALKNNNKTCLQNENDIK